MANSPLSAIKDHGVFAVAQALGGLKPTRSGHPRHGMGPCPVCAQRTRHRKSRDKRGAIGVTPDGLGWHCFQCGAKGNAASLAAAIITGTTKPDRTGWKEVISTCSNAGLCNADIHQSPSPRTNATPARPPSDQVHAFWDGCTSAADHVGALVWLHRRDLDFTKVADFDLARAIRSDMQVPSWAHRKGRPWPSLEYSLVVPLYDCQGALTSLHARNVNPDCPSADKATSPSGYQISGLVMACPLTRLWLTGTKLGDETSPDQVVSRVGLVVTEGVPDWLTWASKHSEADELAPAVIGILAGSWSREIADKVPEGCKVTIATHHDDAGNQYATQITQTFHGRMRTGSVLVRRIRPRRRSVA